MMIIIMQIIIGSIQVMVQGRHPEDPPLLFAHLKLRMTIALDDAGISLVAVIAFEVSMFQREKSCSLCDDSGKYNCPLQWWKVNVSKYPYLRRLAKRLFCIPATSAPSEHVFSAASNIINKKRACLTPTNAALLMFLQGNKHAVSWG